MARKPDSHHVLPLWCDDLIASTVDMTPACFGAYMRLLCYAWTRDGIPDDEAACSRIAGGLEPGDWEAIRSRLTETENGRLTHQRLELERLAVEEIREQRSEAGKLGNAVRWGSQRDRKPIANRSQTDRKSIAPNPNPNPYPSHTEEEQPAAPVPTSDSAKPSRSRAKSLISWAADAGWSGITDADRQGWATAYPGAVLDRELAKASEWLKANPSRAGKRNWRAFLVRWLQRCQDQGGTNREPGRRPDDKPQPKVWKDQYRPAPYRSPKEVAAVAATLKLKEEDL
jgi:uncharacterized protein YdaU (DUF1376 family)